MLIERYYRALFSSSLESFGKLQQDADLWPLFAECHSIARDMNRLADAISGRPEVEMFKLAIREYQFSQYAMASSHYRHAFVGLRLSFEMMLSSIYYSAHEMDYWLWSRGRKDVRWAGLLDENNGLFSDTFSQAFFPELSPLIRQYKALAEKLYRECSEYVHGNPNTHEVIPESLDFDRGLAESWCARAKLVKQVVLFAFCLAYLPRLTTGLIAGVEQVLMDGAGHIKEIRDFLGGVKKHD